VRARSLFDIRLPGHPEDGKPSPLEPRRQHRCPACGGRVSDKDAIKIAGVALHLGCALYRRRAG
jgi:hypothetical protein